jgi:hypothetical protein
LQLRLRYSRARRFRQSVPLLQLFTRGDPLGGDVPVVLYLRMKADSPNPTQFLPSNTDFRSSESDGSWALNET